jgi:hypothetical protein
LHGDGAVTVTAATPAAEVVGDAIGVFAGPSAPGSTVSPWIAGDVSTAAATSAAGKKRDGLPGDRHRAVATATATGSAVEATTATATAAGSTVSAFATVAVTNATRATKRGSSSTAADAREPAAPASAGTATAIVLTATAQAAATDGDVESHRGRDREHSFGVSTATAVTSPTTFDPTAGTATTAPGANSRLVAAGWNYQALDVFDQHTGPWTVLGDHRAIEHRRSDRSV